MLTTMLRDMLLGEWMICYLCSGRVWIDNLEHTSPHAVTDDDYLCASCEITGGSYHMDSDAEQLNSEERRQYINGLMS